MDDMLTLIYPEKRRISPADVISWARDRMADNAIEVEQLRRHDNGEPALTDDDRQKIVDETQPESLRDAIGRLEDDGAATFSRLRHVDREISARAHHHPVGCVCADCSAAYDDDAIDPRMRDRQERI